MDFAVSECHVPLRLPNVGDCDAEPETSELYPIENWQAMLQVHEATIVVCSTIYVTRDIMSADCRYNILIRQLFVLRSVTSDSAQATYIQALGSAISYGQNACPYSTPSWLMTHPPCVSDQA